MIFLIVYGVVSFAIFVFGAADTYLDHQDGKVDINGDDYGGWLVAALGWPVIMCIGIAVAILRPFRRVRP